jgi:hypothetical protein
MRTYQIVRIVDGSGARRLLGGCSTGRWDHAEGWAPEAKTDCNFQRLFFVSRTRTMGVPRPRWTASLGIPAGMAARWEELGIPTCHMGFGADQEQCMSSSPRTGGADRNREARLEELREEPNAQACAVEIVHRQDARSYENRREHFGFADGIGQPTSRERRAAIRGDGTALAGGGWAPVIGG